MESQALGISNAGQVVGWLKFMQGPVEPFLWEDGLMSLIGDLGLSEGEAHAISDAGQIVGWSVNSFENQRAFIWQDGVMQDLGTLTGSGNSQALDINEFDQVVGWSDSFGGTPHAFRVQIPSVLEDLGTLVVGGAFESQAFGINNNNQVVGRSDSSMAAAIPSAFIVDGFSPMANLGIFANGDFSEARDISDASEIVGFASIGTGGPNHAFLKDAEGPLQDLGTLGGDNSSAFAVNNAGQVVGESEIASGSAETHAFLYEDGKILDLNDLIPMDTGWELVGASDINKLGQIVGWGLVNGATHAFLLEPTVAVKPISIRIDLDVDRPGVQSYLTAEYILPATHEAQVWVSGIANLADFSVRIEYVGNTVASLGDVWTSGGIFAGGAGAIISGPSIDTMGATYQEKNAEEISAGKPKGVPALDTVLFRFPIVIEQGEIVTFRFGSVTLLDENSQPIIPEVGLKLGATLQIARPAN
jgi:probable HAF family extracellular repeat protein